MVCWFVVAPGVSRCSTNCSSMSYIYNRSNWNHHWYSYCGGRSYSGGGGSRSDKVKVFKTPRWNLGDVFGSTLFGGFL